MPCMVCAASFYFLNSVAKHHTCSLCCFAIPFCQKGGGVMKSAYKEIFNSYPDVVNAKQLSEMLHISLKKCYQLLKNREIKSIKIGTDYRIPKVYIFEYLGI